MSMVSKVVDLLEREWENPRKPIDSDGEESPFFLACKFDRSPSRGLDQIALALPSEMAEFWSVASRATLFVDVEYGQWGLELLSPLDALAETKAQRKSRPKDVKKSDLVIGRFLGDSDVLVLRCDPKDPCYGSVAVGFPIWGRADWPIVAPGFARFLELFSLYSGEKYWSLPQFEGLATLKG